MLHYLLKGKQQIILVLVRGLKKIEFEKPMEEFNNNYSREYVENNHVRNYTAGFTETMGAP